MEDKVLKQYLTTLYNTLLQTKKKSKINVGCKIIVKFWFGIIEHYKNSAIRYLFKY